MKKFFLFIYLFLIWCNHSFANSFTYNCNLNSKFKLGTDNQWDQKYVKFTISSSGNEKIKIYDHEIESYYSPEMTIVYTDEKMINAVSIDNSSGLEGLSINKKNGYTHLVFLSSKSSTTIHFGFCE